MMNKITTTRNGFRVEDITFKGMRKQSEINNELPQINSEVSEVNAPISLTPEQVKAFYRDKISQVKNTKEVRVYEQTIKWIDDMLEYRKKLVSIEVKQADVKDENPVEDVEV